MKEEEERVAGHNEGSSPARKERGNLLEKCYIIRSKNLGSLEEYAKTNDISNDI